MTSGHLQDKFIVRLLRLIAPGTKGKERLARFFLAKHRYDEDITVTDKFGFTYQIPSVAEPVGFSLLINGVYEPDSLNFFMNYLRPGDTYIDIGANIGAYTLPCASKIGPSGSVIAIEASPSIFSYLTANIGNSTLKNIFLENVAAAAVDNQNNDFYEAPKDHFGMGSFGPQFGAVPIKVPCRRLDSILKDRGISQVRAVKIDVEGYESHVFEGAPSLLAATDAPLIIFEFADWAERRIGLMPGQSQKRLREYGYEIWRLNDFIQNKEPMKDILEEGCLNLIAQKSK